MSDYGITVNLHFPGTKTRVELNGSCLKQDSVTFNCKKLVNIYIVYEISKSFNIRDYPTLESCLFGAVTLTKNADINKCKNFRYGIWFKKFRAFKTKRCFSL